MCYNRGFIILLWLTIFIVLINETAQEYKHFSLEDHKLCSLLSKRKQKYEAFIVEEGRLINNHAAPWVVHNTCNFEVHSLYHRGGIIAVIQSLNLRKNNVTGHCIDYIEFRAKNEYTIRYCEKFEAQTVMSKGEKFLFSRSNSIIDPVGKLDVIIYIDKQPLEIFEKTELKVVFTSYKECVHTNYEYLGGKSVKPCDEDANVCINEQYFSDGYVNCPYYGCIDEDGCTVPGSTDSKPSLGNKVLIGSLSTLVLLFALFVFLIWAFKKHKLFCWEDNFAHPTLTTENNRNSQVVELNEQTGARLAESQAATVPPSAPEEDKDLPPSYDSLFPNSR